MHAQALAVRSMFDRISPTYDLLNHLLSLGIDRGWRRRAVTDLLRDLPPGPIVDLCAGTLDLSAELEQRLNATLPSRSWGVEGGPLSPSPSPSRPEGRPIVAVDLSRQMLVRGCAAGKTRSVEVAVADAMRLPFADGSVAGIICGFGVRNLPDARLGAREARRVLAPGGALVVLEFFQPTRWVTRLFHAVYARVVLPTVGGIVSRDREAYRYLAKSMKAFLARDAYAQVLREEGFGDVSAADLTLGVASIVRGVAQ